ncbi:MAG: hypothetical protein RMK29_11440 [Myxococcales bacterium]|nr:hypothetical protein [Myxococcota bacterium]MDW8282321.1 hypothetical protein [Myxococcales bacterium]
MRFCPFCAQETSDSAGRCEHCGRRLGARTMQHAALSVQKPPPKETILGLGPPSNPDGEGYEGPTTVGGPAGISLPEGRGPASDRPLDLPLRPFGGGGRKADSALEEDTHLPPPAPGMEPLSAMEATNPAIRTAWRPSGPSSPPMRPRGQAPVRRLPDDARPVSGQPLEPTAVLSSPGAHDLTTPLASVPAEALIEDPSGPERDSPSQGALALPPPPGPPSSQTPLLAPRMTGSHRLTVLTLGELPPIPAAPSAPGLMAALRYLWPVARGLWARRKEQGHIRRNLVRMQQSLDGILLRLGRVAFEEGLDTPHLREEMSLLRLADKRRSYALDQTTQLLTVRQTEEQRRSVQEAELQRQIAALSREAEQLDAELRQRAAERRRLLGELSAIDADLRRLARIAEQAELRAAQAQGPAASQWRARAESARGQSEALRPQREARQRNAEALEAPMAELTQRLAVTRSELGLRRQELRRQQHEKTKLLAELDADMRRSQAEQEAAEREMQQRMMTIGTIVNLNRPVGARYEPLYQEIDEVKAQLTAYEATLARLDTESISYDQEAVQKGLLLLGGMGFLLGLMVAALYVLWALARR